MEMLDPLRKPLRFWMTGSLAVVMAALATARAAVDDERQNNPRRVVRHSRYTVDETASRIEAAARQAGQGVIARVEAEGLVIVLASAIGGTPVVMTGDGAPPDVPLSVHLRHAADGGADVLLTSPAQVLLGENVPPQVAEELAALPGLLERALG